MSIHAVSWALKVQDVSPSQKLTLIALANYADGDGVCWPSMQRLAAETCQSRSTIIRSLRALEAANLISRRQRTDDQGVRTSNFYQLAIGVSVTQGSVTVTPGVVSQCDGGSVTVTHKPSIEPSVRTKDITSSSDFDAFWQAYPRKVGKGAARKAYAKAMKATEHATLMAALGVYMRTKPEWQDWCHPTTWLNQERWEDEAAPGTGAGPPTLTDRQQAEADDADLQRELEKINADIARKRNGAGGTVQPDMDGAQPAGRHQGKMDDLLRGGPQD